MSCQVAFSRPSRSDFEGALAGRSGMKVLLDIHSRVAGGSALTKGPEPVLSGKGLWAEERRKERGSVLPV